MIQSFRKVKIDSNDTLYSKIIRFGRDRCDRCDCTKSLQCAHIVGRGHYAVRFALEPVKNAISLCSGCHDWFDSHKITAVLFDEKKRVFSARDESYTFLVSKPEYSWEKLQLLYVKGQTFFCGYSFKKKQIGIELKEKYLELLENSQGLEES